MSITSRVASTVAVPVTRIPRPAVVGANVIVPAPVERTSVPLKNISLAVAVRSPVKLTLSATVVPEVKVPAPLTVILPKGAIPPTAPVTVTSPKVKIPSLLAPASTVRFRATSEDALSTVPVTSRSLLPSAPSRSSETFAPRVTAPINLTVLPPGPASTETEVVLS